MPWHGIRSSTTVVTHRPSLCSRTACIPLPGFGLSTTRCSSSGRVPTIPSAESSQPSLSPSRLTKSEPAPPAVVCVIVSSRVQLSTFFASRGAWPDMYSAFPFFCWSCGRASNSGSTNLPSFEFCASPRSASCHTRSSLSGGGPPPGGPCGISVATGAAGVEGARAREAPAVTCGPKVNASSSALATTSVNEPSSPGSYVLGSTTYVLPPSSATSSSCSSFLYFDFLTMAFATSGVRTGWPRSPCSSSSPAGCQSARVPFCAIVSLNVPPRDGASAYVGLKVHVSGFFGQPPAVFWATDHEPVTSWRPIAPRLSRDS